MGCCCVKKVKNQEAYAQLLGGAACIEDEREYNALLSPEGIRVFVSVLKRNRFKDMLPGGSRKKYLYCMETQPVTNDTKFLVLKKPFSHLSDIKKVKQLAKPAFTTFSRLVEMSVGRVSIIFKAGCSKFEWLQMSCVPGQDVEGGDFDDNKVCDVLIRMRDIARSNAGDEFN